MQCYGETKRVLGTRGQLTVYSAIDGAVHRLGMVFEVDNLPVYQRYATSRRHSVCVLGRSGWQYLCGGAKA